MGRLVAFYVYGFMDIWVYVVLGLCYVGVVVSYGIFVRLNVDVNSLYIFSFYDVLSIFLSVLKVLIYLVFIFIL